jgi:restriction endonuclease S subunit
MTDTMLQRQKQYSCGICGTQPDQISHHKSHCETDKHKTKRELFKLQLEKMTNDELITKYNTDDLIVILEGVETIITDFILEDGNKKLKSKNKKDVNKNTIKEIEDQDKLEEISKMEQEAQQANEHMTEISNRDALRDKIHEIHNYLRNNGAGYGMSALKAFNIFYGLKKFEMCNNEYVKKLKQGELDLYAKFGLNDKCRFSIIMEKIKYINNHKFNDPLYPKSPEHLDIDFKKYILDDVLDGINASKLNHYLMYEIPRELSPRTFKHIIQEIDSITDVEKKCNVLLSGKIYEYFIGRDETAISELGAYFTDRHIVNYIYDEKIKPKPDENGIIPDMIDMFGGSGGFTTGYIDYLIKNYPDKIDWSKEITKIYHYDMNKDVIKSAWLEMFCLTGELPKRDNVEYKNSFMDEFGNKKYKLIITNPPYGGDKVSETDTQIKHSKIKDYIKKILPTIENIDEKTKLTIQLKEIEKEEKIYKQKLENTKVGLNVKGQPSRSSKRINKFAEEHNITGANDKESVSLIMLMDMVDIGGTVCGVLKEGVFFNKTYKDIRKCLVENYNVREVISVPSDQFENTSTKTSIIIFDNLADKKTSTVKFSEMIVERYDEDKFIVKNGYVYLVENKGDIARVIENEVSSASKDEILVNSICSLNGKDYNKKTIEVGEGFKLVKLGDIVKFKKGKQISKKDFIKGNVPVIGGGISPTGFHNQFNMEENTILCSSSGNNAGYINRYDTKVWASDCFAIIPNDNINKDYIYYILKILQNYIFKLQNGSAQPHIYSSDLEKHIKLPIPTTDQSIQQWVDKISKPFDEKNTKEKKLKDLEEKVQTRIKEITENEDCDEVELGSICEIRTGKLLSKNDAITGDFNVYGGGGVSFTHNTYNCQGFNILISRVGTNNVLIINEKFYLTDNGYVLEYKNELYRKFISYYIFNNKDIIRNIGNGSNQKVIAKSKLSLVKIPIPKDKSLITSIEPTFQEIEKLQNEVKQAETLYKQYLDELAKAAIKQSSLPIQPMTNNIIQNEDIEPILEEPKLESPKSKKVVITKRKSPKSSSKGVLLDDILGASSEQ